jgi:hypothetical protein
LSRYRAGWLVDFVTYFSVDQYSIKRFVVFLTVFHELIKREIRRLKVSMNWLWQKKKEWKKKESLVAWKFLINE